MREGLEGNFLLSIKKGMFVKRCGTLARRYITPSVFEKIREVLINAGSVL